MTAARKLRIAEHIEIAWVNERCMARCPNCGETAEAEIVLDIDYRPPDRYYAFKLRLCPKCGARSFDNVHSMNYATDELVEIGWHTYQIQTGAGVWPIADSLSRIPKPAGARALEIGGAYGFGLDFGLRAMHWIGEGYDPSPLAAHGARELGLQLRQAYFTEADLASGPYDIAIATEVVEHLADPSAFLVLMFRALGQGGILVLTTPDGESISPALGPADLLPILSPGAHLVLHSTASLDFALRQAGFQHVEIRRSGLSLIAYASAAAFTLRDDPAWSRARYRQYLLDRSRTASQIDLVLGFAGRGLFEAVNDGDFSTARAAWEMLRPAVRQHFGIDLDTVTKLPEGAADASLKGLARLMPLGLGMILYAGAMQALAEQIPRSALRERFRLAIAALDALQTALARRSLTDALSAALRAAAETELMLCLAEDGDHECVVHAAADALRRDPQRRVTAWRVFIALVNRGHFARALELQETAGLYAPDDDLSRALRCDALFTTGILALQNEPDWPRAAAIFAQLRHLLTKTVAENETQPNLFWPTVRGEFLALSKLNRRDEALALLRQLVAQHPNAPEDLLGQLPAPIFTGPEDSPFENAYTSPPIN